MSFAAKFWCWVFGHSWISTAYKGDAGARRCIHCGKEEK